MWPASSSATTITFSATSRAAAACSNRVRNGNGKLANLSRINDIARMRQEVDVGGIAQREHFELRLALPLADVVLAVRATGTGTQRHDAQWPEAAAAAL